MIAKKVSINNKLADLILFSIVIVTPLLFTAATYEIFELPKITFLYLSSGLLAILVGVKIIRTEVFSTSPILTPLLFILAAYVLSTLFAFESYTSITGYYTRFHGGLLSISAYLIIAYSALELIKKHQLTKILDWALIGGVIVAVYALLQKIGIDRHYWVEESSVRVFSTLGQPNWLADYMNLLLPLSLARGLSYRTNVRKWLFYGCGLLFILVVFWTKSLTGLLSAILIMGIFGGIRFQTKYKYLLFSVLAILAFLGATNPHIQERVNETGKIRKLVWQGSLDTFEQSSAKERLIGYGPGNFAYAFLPQRPMELNQTTEWDFLFNKPHNEILDILINLGLVGLGVYAYFFFQIINRFLQHFRKSGDLLAFGILASWLAIVGSSLTGFITVVTGLFFFLLPALLFIRLDLVKRVPLNGAGIKKTILLLSILSIGILLAVWGILSFFADYYYNSSRKNFQKGNLNEALEFNQQAITYNPYEPRYSRDQAFYNTQQALLTRNRTYAEEADHWQTKALNINPNNSLTIRAAAANYLNLSGLDSIYLEKAKVTLENSFKIIPSDARLRLLYAQALLREGDREEALFQLDKALELKGDFSEAQQVKRQLLDQE
jgi:putative inorganic carbon (hco3(-)) transporter